MPIEENVEYAIRVQDVSKVYRWYDKPVDRLKDFLSGKKRGNRGDNRDQWLRQIYHSQDYYRGADTYLRGGAGGGSDLGFAGAGGRI